MKIKGLTHLVRTLLIAAIVASNLGSVRADVRDGLVAWSPLDVDSGTNTTPDAAFGDNMGIVNGAIVTNGIFNNAFLFTVSGSVSKYLVINHTTDATAAGLPIFNAPSGYTITLWVKSVAATAHYIFTEGSTANAN